MSYNNQLSSNVLEIQRMSTEDGPGLRTTVFLKGCSLKCKWCHNPESISKVPQIQWIGNRCIGCQTCLETCRQNSLAFSESGLQIDRSCCEGCGECADACPSTALELMGTEWELEALIKEVIKDKAYFDKSNGGVTVSGGEPALQPMFVTAFLKGLKEKGIQTALDTCGLCSRSALEMILPHSTMVLFDLKEIDPAKHKEFTGGDLDKILDNLLLVRDTIRSHVHPKTLWIRTPIIPGTTDRHENILGIGRFLAENMGNVVDRWELCSFNNLCKDKYQRLGLKWDYENSELKSENELDALLSTARKSGINPDLVMWSGSTTRLDEETGKENEKNII
jgi:pyruvate formate lyase activating enzyme